MVMEIAKSHNIKVILRIAWLMIFPFGPPKIQLKGQFPHNAETYANAVGTKLNIIDYFTAMKDDRNGLHQHILRCVYPNK
jgi:hypothetical protein